MNNIKWFLKNFLFTIALSAIIHNSQAQYPEEGHPCPDFKLKITGGFPQSVVSPRDFLGKWLILDFWNGGCSSCIDAFPKINAYQKKYADKLQFLVIGAEPKDPNVYWAKVDIRALYEKYRKGLNLQMAYGFDSALANRMGVASNPWLIIIDPQGIVRYVTHGLGGREANLVDILAGKPVQLDKAYRDDEQVPAFKEPPRLAPGGITRGEDSSIQVSSLIYRWQKGMAYGGIPVRIFINERGTYECGSATLGELYMCAYTGRPGVGEKDSLYGKFYPIPLLEVKDTYLYGNKMKDGDTLRTYGYILQLPPSRRNAKEIMATMQRDLKFCFGHEGKIESRMMPYWKLVATPEAREKLKTKGAKPDTYGRRDTGYTWINQPAKYLALMISGFGFDNSKVPVIDETGITGNIDITMSGLQIDFETIRRALRANGLDLIEGRKEMRVLVIRDAPPL